MVSAGKLFAKPGRPKGAKDREPRRRRAGLAYHNSGHELVSANNELSRPGTTENIGIEMFDIGVMHWGVEKCAAPFDDPFHGDWAYWRSST